MKALPFVFFSILLFIRCANIVPPTGGPRDTAGPVVKSSYPANGTVNFQNNFITVTYDELIQDNQLSSKVIVSPSIQGIYKVKIKKNILRLEWADTLKPNTTYTFNLANGIKDITEGTVSPNYAITFSTGPVIDSNIVRAVIHPIPGNKVSPETKLLLFPVMDSVEQFYKQKPDYITQLSDSGSVVIPFIKAGNYDLLAIIDYNKNSTWEYTEPFDIQKNIKIENEITKEFYIQNTVLDTCRLISTSNTDKTIKLLFSKGLQKISIKNDEGMYVVNKVNSREYTISNQFRKTDTTNLFIQIVDSVGNKSSIQKKVKFKEIDIQKNKDSIINISDINNKSGLKPLKDSILFKSNKYIDSFPFIIHCPKNVTYRIKTDNPFCILYFNGQKAGDTIYVTMYKDTVRSIYNERNALVQKTYVTQEEKNFGNISFTIKTDKVDYTIYLMNSSKNIVYTSNAAKHVIKNMDPGTYTLYAVIDTNKNGYWDGFDPIRNIPAEPIIYFKDPISIKANWDIEDIQFIF